MAYQRGGELFIFEGRISLDISQYCNISTNIGNNCHLESAQFTHKDYRKIFPLKSDKIYVSPDINSTALPSMQYDIIEDTLDWKRISRRNRERNLCRRCKSPKSRRCNTLTHGVTEIKDCKGKILENKIDKKSVETK